jgi:hypothetical protein
VREMRVRALRDRAVEVGGWEFRRAVMGAVGDWLLL